MAGKPKNVVTPQEVYDAALRIQRRYEEGLSMKAVRKELGIKTGLLGYFSIYKHPLREAYFAAKRGEPLSKS